MKNKWLMASVALGVLSFASAFAQVTRYEWVGGGGDNPDQGFTWDTGANWSTGTEPDSYKAEAVFAVNRGLHQGYGVRLQRSKAVHSLLVDLPRFTAITANTKTLRFAENGTLALSERYNTAGGTIFTSTNRKHRAYVNAAGSLTLRNDGRGEAGFLFASLQNDNRAKAGIVLTFEGVGNWRFGPPAYLGRQSKEAGSEADSAHGVSVQLAEGKFSGVLAYAAQRPMRVSRLAVGGGTLRLENSAITIDEGGEGVLVYPKGRLSGAGTISGALSVAGELDVGHLVEPATLTVTGRLLLADGAKATLRIFGTKADSIVTTAQEAPTLGGTLLLQAIRVPEAAGSWQLIKAGAPLQGAFAAVRLGQGAFESADNGKTWALAANGGRWAFDSASGVLTFSKD